MIEVARMNIIVFSISFDDNNDRKKTNINLDSKGPVIIPTNEDNVKIGIVSGCPDTIHNKIGISVLMVAYIDQYSLSKNVKQTLIF